MYCKWEFNARHLPIWDPHYHVRTELLFAVISKQKWAIWKDWECWCSVIYPWFYFLDKEGVEVRPKKKKKKKRVLKGNRISTLRFSIPQISAKNKFLFIYLLSSHII